VLIYKRINSKHAFSPLTHRSLESNSSSPSSLHGTPQQEEEEELATPAKIDSVIEEFDTEVYPTLASPTKYFLFLAIFVVCPVGAFVFFYGGGKERFRKWKATRGYEKMDLGKA
jgi:hypothetical protein